MKYYKQALALLALLVFFSTSILAQEEEMTSEEWEAEIARLTQEKADLTAELEGLQAEVNAMTEKKNSLQSFEDCQKSFPIFLLDQLCSASGVLRINVRQFPLSHFLNSIWTVNCCKQFLSQKSQHVCCRGFQWTDWM